MNVTYIVAVYTMIDDVLDVMKYQEDSLSKGQVHRIRKYRKNMRGNSAEDAALIAAHRHTIETVNSQLEKMGLQRLHARSNVSIALKTLASLITLACTNFID